MVRIFGLHFGTYTLDVAEVVLNKCTVNDPDIKNLDDQRYRVVYNYEFMEDTKDDRVVW